MIEYLSALVEFKPASFSQRFIITTITSATQANHTKISITFYTLCSNVGRIEISLPELSINYDYQNG